MVDKHQRTSRNPMYLMACFATLWIVFDAFGIYMALATEEGMLWGFPIQSQNAMNLVAPFRIVCLLTFLFLYIRQSKYAWHIMMVPILLDIPIYYFLQACGIYFQERSILSHTFTLIAWICFLLYMLKFRMPYKHFISTLEDYHQIILGQNVNKKDKPNRTLAKHKLKLAAKYFFATLILVAIFLLLLVLAVFIGDVAKQVYMITGRFILLAALLTSIMICWSLISALIAMFEVDTQKVQKPDANES